MKTHRQFPPSAAPFLAPACLEPLESRIAPAALTFSDVDGDLVTITTTKGTVTDLAGAVLLSPFAGLGQQLMKLDLTLAAAGTFTGANVSIVAKRFDADLDGDPDGDGLVNAGFINAAGIDLGTVLVDGDLGALDAGDSANAASACKGLSVFSLGRFGTSTGAPDLQSDFDGKLDKLTVKSDVKEALVNVTDSVGANGTIGSVAVGGSLVGGAAPGSGSIVARDSLGLVKIGHDVQGGTGPNTGFISTDGTLAGVTLGGSLLGSVGNNSGEIRSNGDLGLVKIMRDVKGGTGIQAGFIASNGKLAGVSIGGSLLGGSNTDTGRINSGGDLGPVKIGRDIEGGSGPDSGSIHSVSGKVGAVTVGGSVLGGDGGGSGIIFSGGDMGLVKIRGDLRGGEGGIPGLSLPSGIIFSSAKLAGASIGGSLVGGSAAQSGRISSTGDMGPVKIGGDAIADGVDTAQVVTAGTLAGITVGGSIDGGRISGSGAMGAVKIGGDLRGGDREATGGISSGADLASVTIGGSVVGTLRITAFITSAGDLGPVKIGGDLRGASISGTQGQLDTCAYIEADRIASVFIGGSIIAGTDTSSNGAITFSASIRAADDIGSITVKGSLVGNIGDGTPANFTPVVISARGQETVATGAKTDVAIKSLTVVGRVEYTQIVGGSDLTLGGSAVSGDAQIGAVKVGGDWIASRLAAGTDDGGDNIAGTDDDTFLGAGNAAIVSRIATISIKGQVLGTAGGTDSFRFMAEKIGSLKVAGTAFPLTTAAENLAVGVTSDFRVFDSV